jgi:meiotically up-regulated gene 157 (Mug157) protein
MKIDIILVGTLLILICQPAPINDTIACVRAYIDTFQNDLDPKIFAIFKNAFPNTLETTVQHYDLTKGN